MTIDDPLFRNCVVALSSPRLRTAPTVAHEEYDYSMDLRVAKWGPMPTVHGSISELSMSAMSQTKKNSARAFPLASNSDISSTQRHVSRVPTRDILVLRSAPASRCPRKSIDE